MDLYILVSFDNFLMCRNGTTALYFVHRSSLAHKMLEVLQLYFVDFHLVALWFDTTQPTKCKILSPICRFVRTILINVHDWNLYQANGSDDLDQLFYKHKIRSNATSEISEGVYFFIKNDVSGGGVFLSQVYLFISFFLMH